MKAIGILSTGALLWMLSVTLAFFHPWGDVRHAAPDGQLLGGANLPADVRRSVEQSCGDCHSNRTRWPVYSRLAPVSWLIEHDVHDGREALNFSEWERMRSEDRIAALARIAAAVRSGEMPPAAYSSMHRDNRLSDPQKQRIAAWTKAERLRLRTIDQPKGTGGQ